MRVIRRNTFETNSSSTHSLTMCTHDEYEKWKNGELVFDRWNDKLVLPQNKDSEEDDYYDKDYFTYDEFFDYYCDGLETYSETHTTPNGEKIVCFGYYGYNG